jgi:4-oxalocrotonate tautomerase
MPLVRMTLMRDAVSGEDRQELIARFTDAAAAVLGQDIRPYVWVLLDEVGSGDWGIGGHPITRDDVAAIRQGAPA